MSHFTVLVIGQDPEKQLQPFHEFECTGVNDRYVQDICELNEARMAYETRMVKLVKVPAGTLVKQGVVTLNHEVHGVLIDYWDDCFVVEKPNPSILGGVEKVREIPEGYELIEVPVKEIRSFREFCDYSYERPVVKTGQEIDLEGDHKWGYMRVDENGEVVELINRTNPDRKWDWYQLGGRWRNFFKMKPSVRGIQGEAGLFTGGAQEGYADSAFKGDIDFDAMCREAEEAAAADYDRVRAVLDQHPPIVKWEEVCAKYLPSKTGETPQQEGGIDAARQEYHDQPGIKALRELSPWLSVSPYQVERETFVRQAGLETAVTFAVLKDGKWYERGSMGWWGMVSNEKENDAWNEEFAKLVQGLPDDTLLSVYDCHI